MLERPGVEQGRNVPSKHTAFDLKKLSEEELKKHSATTRAWVQKGMSDDAKKA